MSKWDMANILFPSEDEIVEEVRKEKTETSKKRKAEIEANKPSSSKKSKPNSLSTKPTARDLFGSDSEDDNLEQKSSAFKCGDDLSSHSNKNEYMKLNDKSNPKNEIYYIKCDKCDMNIAKEAFVYHQRTNIHKSNCLIKSQFNNVDIIATAFKNRIMTYRLNASFEDEILVPETFLNKKRDDITKIIQISLSKHTCVKVNFELYAYFVLEKSKEKQLKSFNTKYQIVSNNEDIDECFLNFSETCKNKLTEFDHCESGWSLISISHLEININKYSPMRGGTYIELPTKIRNTKSCLNIQNNDQFCFLWSIVAALFPTKNNVCRTSSYPHFSLIFNIDGMSFPPTPKDIKIFERNNGDISINIYGLDKYNNVTGPLYLTKTRKLDHVNLLYFERNNKAHYCLIKDLLCLVRRQVSKSKARMHFCETCLQFFSSNCKYLTHNCSKVVTLLPKENSVLQFKNYERQQKINFVIYADFECLLSDIEDINDIRNTVNTKLHQPSCFGFYICCSHDSSLNKYVTYRGMNCVKVFIKRLIEEVLLLNQILKTEIPMKPLSKEQMQSFHNSINCHICNNLLLDDKVHDHDHITGDFRGAAHSYCNLKFRLCPFIPIVFHNLSGYDAHIFITELCKYDGDIHIIPKSKEKYISFTKIIRNEKQNTQIQLKFLDSFQFLSSSLDVLSKSLDKKDFIQLAHNFSDISQFELIKQKGIYPYDYVDSWQKYDENVLPNRDDFYNSLRVKHVTDIEYNHAQLVWKTFNINSIGEYTDLYLKCDVLLLCDVFENFRKICLQHYHLDPLYYVSSPGLSWDAMLLYTGVKLELINNLEIYQMIEKGIRGGLAQCSHRHGKANNKYLPSFDETKPSTYLIYLDCNNLYGYAMTKKLPISDFELMSADNIKNFDLQSTDDDGEYGYILEVDMKYPEKLHNLHSDLPFAPEKFIPIGGKTEKLIANLYDKYQYVIHFVHLKECLNKGLILRKIHRIIKFRQENFLKKYIDLNTGLRQAATTAFERDFFKLLNNSIFGKTIENKRKQVDVKLVTTWSDSSNKTNKSVGAEKLISKPNFKSISVFNENFAAIQLNHEKLVLDRPIYVGFAVLEYSKQHLYNFHYSFIKEQYGEKAKLCYTDTDSLLYLVETTDFYKDMSHNLSVYDTCNFETNNPYGLHRVNEKIPGLFKSELGGDIISEFIGLRAKLYCIKSSSMQIIKAKGISKPVTKSLNMSDYRNVLHNDVILKRKMCMIKSIKHILYSQEVNKVTLNGSDDKRQILPNRIDSLPWGHCDTMF